jgi:hypothetical protein
VRLFGDPSSDGIDEDDRAGICTPPFDLGFELDEDVPYLSGGTEWDGRRELVLKLQMVGLKPVYPYRANRVLSVIAKEYLRRGESDRVHFHEWTGTLAPSASLTINLNSWTTIFGETGSFAKNVHGLLVFNFTTPAKPEISFGPKTPDPYGGGMFGSSSDKLIVPATGFATLHGEWLGTTGTRKNIEVSNLNNVESADYLVIAYGVGPLPL